MNNFNTGHQSQVQALRCYAGREKDSGNNWRYVLPYEDPCLCTSLRLGGWNTVTPKRSFDPLYADEVIITDDVEKIRKFFGVKCKGR